MKNFSSKIKANNLNGFVSRYLVNYYQSDRNDIAEIQDMMKYDPITKFCIEVIYLYMFAILGDYSHPSARITKNIRDSIINCDGSWVNILKKISSCYWYGYSFSEVAVETTKFNRKILSKILTYNPLNYNFEVKNGKLHKVIYWSNEETKIPYDAGIHLVSNVEANFDEIFGCGRCFASLPYWELHKLMMPVLAIAGQRQATPILVKKTGTSEDVILIDDVSGLPVMDDYGSPVKVKKGWDSIKQLEELGSAGITAIDREDELYSITLDVSSELIQQIIQMCEQYRMIALLVPVTLFAITNSGVGDAGLATSHLEVFRMMISAMVSQLMEEIIEQLIRPLVIYNFGEQASYGQFIIDSNNPISIEIAKVALDAINSGSPSLQDIEMINRVREILGVSELEELVK